MFYFLIAPLLSYNFILIAAAVIPALFLIVKIYRLDVLEQESPQILSRLVIAGIVSSLIALVLERLFYVVLDAFITPGSRLYDIVLYFVVVACVEEGSKYFMLKKTSWYSPEFNCQYDGVVYATAVSLGFALWENISYVTHYGLSNALVRAFTAIPGHASFGVFMGIFYSLAKRAELDGRNDAASTYKFMALAVPIIMHGCYDYIASTSSDIYVFLIFVIAMFIVAYKSVIKVSRNDQYL